MAKTVRSCWSNFYQGPNNGSYFGFESCDRTTLSKKWSSFSSLRVLFSPLLMSISKTVTISDSFSVSIFSGNFGYFGLSSSS